MPSVQIYNYMATRVSNEEIKIGSIERPASVKVIGDVHRRDVTIANAANAVVYNDELSSFNTLFIATDYNTRALITDNAANSFSLSLIGTANTSKYGVGLTLGNDVTSSAARINTIRIFNTSGNTVRAVCLIIK